VVEATRNGAGASTGPVPYVVLVIKESRRDGIRVIETWETGIEGSFSDCCRMKKGVVVPKGYEIVLRPRAYHVATADQWATHLEELRRVQR
jgi:hypothetical protein